MPIGTVAGGAPNQDPGSDRSDWLARHVLPHEPTVRRALRRKGIGAEEIDDVIQDAYLRLLAAASIAHVANPHAYFIRTARSVVLDRTRRRTCLAEEPHDDHYISQLQSHDPLPDQVVDDRLQLEQVRAAFGEIDPRSRTIVALRRLERRTCRETAHALRLSGSAIEKRLRRALRALAAARKPPAGTLTILECRH